MGKKFFFAIQLFLNLCFYCSSLELYPIKINQLYGYIDEIGNLLINPYFERASEFHNGLAVVKFDDKYCFIDIEGNLLLKTNYKYISSFSNNGYALFIDSDNNSGYLNQEGKEIMKFPYKNCSVFSGGYATIGPTEDGEYFIINQEGENINQLKALSCGLYSDGYFVVTNKNGKKFEKFLFTLDGKIIYPPKNYKINGSCVLENCIQVIKNNKKYIWDIEKNNIIEEQNLFFYSKRNNNYIVEDKKSGLFGLVNDSFNFCISPEYESLVFITEKILAYKEDKKYGLMDIFGSKITPAKYFEFGAIYDDFIVFNPRNGIDGGLLRIDGKEFNAASYVKQFDIDD